MTQRLLLIAIILFMLALAGETPASAGTAPDPLSADFVLAAPVLGSRMQLSTESIPTPGLGNYQPAAAYNSRRDEYLVVWQREIDSSTSGLYGRRVDHYGRPIGTGMALLTTGSGYRAHPYLAYNAVNDQYFLVYSGCSPCDSSLSYSVYGRILNFDLSGGSEFEIWGWAGKSLQRPKVAWSSVHNQYLVVWNALDTSSLLFTDVSGRRYAANGTALQNYAVQYRTAYQTTNVDLVYNPQFDEFLITWEESGGGTNFDIYAARVKWDNTIERAAFPVQVAANAQFCPSVTVTQNTRYLVVWTHNYALSDDDIYGRELDMHGDPVGDLIPIDTTTEDTECPVASARPGNGVDTWVIWTTLLPGSASASVAGRHWTDPSKRVLWSIDSGNGPITFLQPAIATGSTGILFAYSGRPTDTQAFRQAYSRLWTADMSYIPLLRK